jgi:hypothetical protein
MINRALLFISLVAMLLAGCSVGGPSNAEAEEVIFGVYFQDARITNKRQCELTPRMEKDGLENAWLVRYTVKDTGDKGAMIITEGDSDEYPWDVYICMVGQTIESIEESCP